MSHSRSLGRILLTSGAIAALAAALCAVQPTAAHAQIFDITPPPDGCLAADSATVAFADTSDVQTASLETAGPVVQVVVEWAGIWSPAPTDSEIGIEISGPGGTLSDTYPGTESTDATGLPTTPEAIAYGYHADVTSLFGAGSAGTYTVNVTPPIDGVDLENANWWGATITAIYDSSPCAQTSTAIWKTGADYYFGGNVASSPTTELVVYDWGYPLPADTTATFRVSHGGADDVSTACRATSIWVATGTGTAPLWTDDLIEDDGSVNPAYGGVEGVANPFAPPTQTCDPPTLAAPVVSFSGGNVGPQWGFAEFEMLLPAGSTWAALQLESPADNGDNLGLPGAGAWAGSGLLLLPAFDQPEPPAPDPAPAPADTLPATGAGAAASDITLAASAAAMLAGALLMMLARRRRRGHATDNVEA